MQKRKEGYKLGGELRIEAGLALNQLAEMFGWVLPEDPAWSEALATLESVVGRIQSAPRPTRRFRVPHRRLVAYGDALAGVVNATREFLQTGTGEAGKALVDAMREAGRYA